MCVWQTCISKKHCDQAGKFSPHVCTLTCRQTFPKGLLATSVNNTDVAPTSFPVLSIPRCTPEPKQPSSHSQRRLHNFHPTSTQGRGLRAAWSGFWQALQKVPDLQNLPGEGASPECGQLGWMSVSGPQLKQLKVRSNPTCLIVRL